MNYTQYAVNPAGCVQIFSLTEIDDLQSEQWCALEFDVRPEVTEALAAPPPDVQDRLSWVRTSVLEWERAPSGIRKIRAWHRMIDAQSALHAAVRRHASI